MLENNKTSATKKYERVMDAGCRPIFFNHGGGHQIGIS